MNGSTSSLIASAQQWKQQTKQSGKLKIGKKLFANHIL
jgi:hypothetical protein